MLPHFTKMVRHLTIFVRQGAVIGPASGAAEKNSRYFPRRFTSRKALNR